ncbi:MAG: flagellar type III secretion system pore protein FliP [Candidatus Gastranaerophilales bacterium]|nr:flagellar type III secretion system pore protein FliP [Candidatus Gastranaerophilales bacterium]
MINKIKKLLGILGLYLLSTNISHAALSLPSINVGMQNINTPQEFTQGVQVLIMLTILTLAPSIIIMTTAFIGIVIVLSLTRQAIGTASLPPNQVIVGLALILTFFVMSPTLSKINDTAYQPYMKNLITQQQALDNSLKPIRDFMFKQTHESELALFVKLAKLEKPKTKDDVPTYVLIPSFVLSELKTAFKIGFIIFLPFLVIDIVVASVLVSMGMMFLPPTTVAMPFKLVMFVMVDGWFLITESLVKGFAN